MELLELNNCTIKNMDKPKGFASILIIIIALILLVLGYVTFKPFLKKAIQEIPQQISTILVSNKTNPFTERYHYGSTCEGKSGTVEFTHSPMNIEDIGVIEPYGIMVDAHVIPTSHGYISPIIFRSERDKYPVYAIADGVIVNVSHRGESIGDNVRIDTTDEYQMYFEHSCTFYSYYDLLTSLAPEIQAEVGKLTGFENKNVRIPVKAGQLVGRIGGQTVDFAVWNFEKEPAYFANPKSYKGDEDRFYLDDMFAYFKEPIKSELLAKAKRTAPPRSGKVDYDIEGKLVGNWFKEGSNGFVGPEGIQQTAGRRYWDGHLSISYDYVDPTKIIFSIGNFEGKAAQFNVVGNNPDPATIGVNDGIIKYELESFNVFKGTVLLQLLEKSKLKVETFPGKRKDEVTGFTSNALIYER